MLRDERMAAYVNLAPKIERGDVYSEVTKLVKQKVAEDAKNPECPKRELAEKISPLITRKLLKQSVMTSVYGVTEYGVKGQVKRWLMDPTAVNNFEFQKVFPESTEQYLKECAIYLAKHTTNAIGQTNTPAWLSMLWLKDCAKKIAKHGYRVCWMTPLNLPCTQPYADATLQIPTSLQRVTVHTHEGVPNFMKQSSAFPPNFVHSLDSTHCLLTARAMHRHGMEFASIHDSFWAHACNVDKLNELLRDEFIHLHSRPLLQHLYQSFVTRYPELDFAPPPQPSFFDLESVRKSEYFFS
ncbi:hypothetical protein RFI_13278 [Reticulomyxa filosa]|uniref:DNA-directed RNA polymerase n=1 Tax=Reticulomyxa filosa TaxID=46433 RepID=X6NC70_RETFI|nr:hypothetical protein RFI_13278 [Reticulomyxa filosa]|eukprot:ETO23880.1 hypothetical protein RFI_13278 [Reticulomyxa filosa]